MPRRSNQRAARLASTTATADDWLILMSAAEAHAGHHHIKAVCLTSQPRASTTATFFAFATTGHPLGTINLKLEDGLENTLVPFDADVLMHPIIELIFQEHDDGVVEGIVLGIKDPSQAVSSTNLVRLRAEYA